MLDELRALDLRCASQFEATEDIGRDTVTRVTNRGGIYLITVRSESLRRCNPFFMPHSQLRVTIKV
jgi:hypothetical protein